MTDPKNPTPIWREIPEVAPSLTPKGDCSACNVAAQIVADGAMKICPRCYAVLWHRQDKIDPRTAELAAQRLRMLAERERIRQERMTLHLAVKDKEPPTREEPKP